MKTIKEWLETLPEPYRSQALENAVNCPFGNVLDCEIDTLYRSISAAFIWHLSPQGGDYWDEYAKSLNQ